jgi:hypothetical protein
VRICGLVKTALLHNLLTSKDVIWDGASIGIWTQVVRFSNQHINSKEETKSNFRNAEEFLGIVAANIPTLKSMLEKLFRALGGNITSMTTKSYSRHEKGIQLQEDYTSNSGSLEDGSNLGRLPYVGSDQHILLTDSKSRGSSGDMPIQAANSPHIVRKAVVSWRDES